MLKLKKIFNSNLLHGIYRNYVSVININADTVKLIKVKPDEYETQSSKEIKIDFIDGDKNLLKSNLMAEINESDEEFNINCHSTKEDTTVIVEVPLSSCNNVQIKINANVRGDIKIDNIPNLKSVDLMTRKGKAKVQNCRCQNINMKATNAIADFIYAYSLNIEAKGNGEESTASVQKCQADYVKISAPRVKIDTCYAQKIDVESTNEALLKTLQANGRFNCSGKVFNTVSFAGTMNANLLTLHTMLHFVELNGDSIVKLTHPEGLIRAGFANEIVKETTNLHILSNCEIKTKSKEFVVCQKAENVFEVIRENAGSDSTLKMIIENGKEFQLIKQSWIDSLNLEF
jgi:hypothetical protein